MPSGLCRIWLIPTPGCITAAIRNTVATASEQRPRTGMRIQSNPARTPKMIARASTLAPTIGPEAGFRNPELVVQPREQHLGVAVVRALHAQRDVAAAVLIQLPVARQDGLDAGVAQLVAEGKRGLEILEVAHDGPVVVGRVVDVDVGAAALTRPTEHRPRRAAPPRARTPRARRASSSGTPPSPRGADPARPA